MPSQRGSRRFTATLAIARMGEAGGHRDWRQPLRRVVRARDGAAAVYAGSADAAKLRSACRRAAARLASRVCRSRPLSRRRRRRDCRCSIRRTRRSGAIGRPHRRLPHGLSIRGIHCRLDLRAHVRADFAGRAGWFAGEVVLFAGGLSWLSVLTHSILAWRFSTASTGSYLRKSSRC